MTKPTFMDLLMATDGSEPVIALAKECLDNFVVYWHCTYAGYDTLAECLGMTQSEYAHIIPSDDALRKIYEDRKQGETK